MEILKIYEKEITKANTFRVAAGTTGRRGGDSGHGSRTIVELEDLAGTSMDIRVIREKPGVPPRGVIIELTGDSEFETFVEAMDFITKTLKRAYYKCTVAM